MMAVVTATSSIIIVSVISPSQYVRLHEFRLIHLQTSQRPLQVAPQLRIIS